MITPLGTTPLIAPPIRPGAKQKVNIMKRSLLSSLRCVKAFVAVVAVALGLVADAAAQQSQTALSSDDILGFESLSAWSATGSSASPAFMLSSTSTRTQGEAAYAVSNPPNMVKLFSQPVSNSATALAGVGNSGSAFRLDILIPVQQGNAVNSGYIQPYINSPSLGLSKVALTQVYFTGLPAGVYTTLSFPIPDAVRTVLSGATFSDLTFELDINSPGKVTGAYLLDNLRVHSPPTDSNTPPPGYGLSVELVAIAGTSNPATASFDASPVQVPEDFHFMKPTDSSSATLELDLGYDGTPSFTCLYGPDPSDSLHYVLASCTGGVQAGDLVGASWARLTILNATTGKVRAQLARNPVGDAVGRGIIPPMPTFWGDFTNCVPAPASAPTDTPVTYSSSCDDQTAQASQIVTNYFNGLDSSTAPQDWIVTPAPDFARRFGDGAPNDNLQGPPPPNDPPFDDEGHMNPGGDWDAYWRLAGSLSNTAISGTDEAKTDFSAGLSAHGVVWGYDVDVLDVQTALDTDTGQTTPNHKDPNASGSIGVYVFGLLTHYYQADTNNAFSVNIADDKVEYEIARVQIWIFSITLKAGGKVALAASGGVSGSGPSVSFGPSVGITADVAGGIDVGVASGTVDAEVELLKVGTPVTVTAKWSTNNNANVCAITVNTKLTGKATISSLGGQIDLVATFGYCPFCFKASETIFQWDPLAEYTDTLFSYAIDKQDFPLPTILCTAPLTVAIDYPAANASLPANIPATVSGHATSTNASISCSSLSWSFDPTSTNAGGVSPTAASGFCSVPVDFGAPNSGSSSTYNIVLNASQTFTDEFNRLITETGSASEPITVTSLPAGVYITELTDAYGNVYTIAGGLVSLSDPGVASTSPYSATYTVYGLLSGISGSPSTYFTASNGTITTNNATSSTPSATWTISAVPTVIDTTTYYSLPGTTTIEMVTTAGGNTYTTTLTVYFSTLQ